MRYSEKRAREIAWGRGGRPSAEETNRQVAREREESRKRAQKRIDERKAISQARYKREDLARRTRRRQAPSFVDTEGWRRVTSYGEPLTSEERAKEAQATIREAQAAELQAEAERKDKEQNWVSEFTPQQRHEISVFETAKGRVRADIGVRLNEAEGMRMIQELDRKIGSYQKISRPRSPSDPPLYPEGQETGKTWTDPAGSGALLGRNEKGEEVVRVKPGDTLEGIQLKERMAITAGQRKRLEKWEDEREKFARSLMEDKISIPQERGWIGKVPDVERYRTPTEVQAELVRVFGAAPTWAQAEIQQPQIEQQQLVFSGEPNEVTQAKAILDTPKTRGMGLKAVAERRDALKILEAWENVQQRKPITESQASRLPPGAEYQRHDGSWWRVP